MTLNEAGSLNEQLKELELLEQEKKQRNSKETNHTKGNLFIKFQVPSFVYLLNVCL